MKHALPLGMSAILAVAAAHAQVGDTMAIGAACSYGGEAIPSRATLFASDREAEDTIKRIVEASGLTQNFEVKAAGVPNAAAVLRDGHRFVLYNPFFITEMRDRTHNRWAPIAIMAHEVGHHLNGHTLTSSGSQPKLELEADLYSGFILQRMGASMADAKSAVESLPDDSKTPSSTHPPKLDRLAAVGSGWQRACDAEHCSDANSSPASGRPSRPTAGRREQNGSFPKTDDAAANDLAQRIRRGPDSCEYARDGECDEPTLCAPGTDTTDCRAPRVPDLATMCVTNFGSCELTISRGPKGGVCTCFTLWGPIVGVAR